MLNTAKLKQLLAVILPVSIAAVMAPGALAQSIDVESTTLPSATIGQDYSATLKATGGTAPYSWSVVSNFNPPPGLTLSKSGVLSGTPTNSGGSCVAPDPKSERGTAPGILHGSGGDSAGDLCRALISPVHPFRPIHPLSSTKETFKVTVTDSSKSPLSATATINIIVNSNPLIITTTSIATGVDGTAYSAPLASAGGTGTVTWTLASGSTLVKGLTLSKTGLISGKPTTATKGAATFGVLATDSAKPVHTATAVVSYVINPENGAFKITTISFPKAKVGNTYSTSLKSTGGTSPVAFSLIDSSALPAGLKLSTSGDITGTPTVSSTGTFIWVQAKDSSKTPLTVDAYLDLVVSPSALTVSPLALTGATVGITYTKTLTVKGGKAPYKWSLVGASTFDGMTLSSAGVLSGKPTAPTVGKTDASFQVKVSDGSTPVNTDYATIAIDIAPAPVVIQTTKLPTATVGTAYTTTLKAMGGIAPFKWAIATGSNPPGGLSLSAAGVLSGKPTTASGAAPTTFKVTVKDSEAKPASVTGTLSIQINPPPAPLAITSPYMPPGYLNTAYNNNLQASGGIPPYTWTVASGFAPPPGLKVLPTGAITGSPTSDTNIQDFTVDVKDSAGSTASASINLPVDPTVVKCSNDGSGNARLKGRYSFELTTIRLGIGALFGSVGAFTADGQGNITGGLIDSNSAYFSAEGQTTFTGTYSVGSDNRGVFNVNVAASDTVTAQNLTYCAALDSISGGVSSHGHLVEDDTGDQTAIGQFYMQGNATEASLDGSWVFGLQGALLNGNGVDEVPVTRQASAGYVTLNGAGKVSAGEMDINGDGYSGGVLANQYTPQVPISGSYTMASTGRGTLTLDIGGSTSHVVFYPTSTNQVLLLTSDPGMTPSGNHTIFQGKGFPRTTDNFSNATLKGKSVYVATGLSDAGLSDQGRHIQGGIVTWDGNGNLSGSADDNKGGTVTLAPANPFTGTYSVDAEGRTTTVRLTGMEQHPPTIYLFGPNQGIGITDNTGVDFFRFENQVVPSGGFTLGSLTGGYSTGTFWYNSEKAQALTGVSSSGGTATDNAIFDTNTYGYIVVDFAGSSTLTPAASGRFLNTDKGASTPKSALYLVSPNLYYTVNIDGSATLPISEVNHQ